MSMIRMCDRIAEISGGRLVINFYGGGEIVTAYKEYEGVDKGLLDMCHGAGSVMREKYFVAPLFTYMINGLKPVEMMLWMMREGEDLFAELLADTNIVNFPGWTGSPESFLSSNEPLRSLADLKGLKIRTLGDDAPMFTEMGASVISVPGGEIYEAMMRGVIDAFQLNCPAIDKTYTTYEVIKYMYISPVRQPCEYYSYFVNKSSWAKLPDDLKAIVQAAALEESMRYLADATRLDAEAIEFYTQYGVEVELTPKDIEDEMARLAEIFYDNESAKDPFLARVVKSQRDFAALHRSLYPQGF